MKLVSFFMYYFSFTAEIVFASLLFARLFERKRFWWLSMTLGIGLMCLVSYFWSPDFSRDGILDLTCKYIAFYLIVIVMLQFSFRCGKWGAIFCGSMGYCIQHIIYNVYSIAARAASIPELETSNAGDILHLLCFAVAYVILALVMWRKNVKSGDMMHRRFMENWSVIIFAVIFLIVATLLDNIALNIAYESGSQELAYLVNIYHIVISICIIYILLSIVRERKAQEEFKSMKLLLHSQHRVYRNNKEMMDSVNLKAHDLKHQIHALDGKIPREQVEEIGYIVDMYDTSIRTGNEALDVVLTEKGGQCTNHEIRLTCLLDGRHIKGFSDTDIYSFFGNAIDNAIDAADRLPKEKRVISITENVQANLINIRIENYCETGPIIFEDGLPTTKGDTRYHGFGTKSMKHIAEKYGGNIFFSHEGEKFIVNLILPVLDGQN